MGVKYKVRKGGVGELILFSENIFTPGTITK
jgi:hypothetical protein